MGNRLKGSIGAVDPSFYILIIFTFWVTKKNRQKKTSLDYSFPNISQKVTGMVPEMLLNTLVSVYSANPTPHSAFNTDLQTTKVMCRIRHTKAASERVNIGW